MAKHDICAVIPAAGRGTRLGLDTPKVLAPVTAGETIWSILASKLLLVADHLDVVMSPWGEPAMRAAIPAAQADRISLSIQPEPTGMGDAVFRGAPVWSAYDRIIVVWGDQVNVSRATLERALARHAGRPRAVVIPIVSLPQPYVEYRFVDGRLDRVLESREGDVCAPGGSGDVGTFVLSTAGLEEAWQAYLATITRGAKTGELNFLPFMTYLAHNGWTVEPEPVEDAAEARGVNTREDLAFAAAHVERLKAGL